MYVVAIDMIDHSMLSDLQQPIKEKSVFKPAKEWSGRMTELKQLQKVQVCAQNATDLF